MTSSPSLRRSLLFVPGAEPRRLDKAKNTDADTIVFDLEDSVSLDQKSRARDLVAEAIANQGYGKAEPVVRINASGTPYYVEDIEAMVQAGIATIMLPKSQSVEEIQEIDRILSKVESPEKPVRLLALVETPAGVLNAAALCTSIQRIEALCFGHADFSLEMGLSNNDASQGVIFHARCQIAMTAKAFQVAPIDNVCLAVKDEAAFRNDVALGIQLGFEGKLCIHPMQATIANEMYTPIASQIQYAQQVVEGWKEAQAKGSGVFTINNKMMDAPLVAAQERILERAQKAGVL